MLADPPRVNSIELEAIRVRGRLVADDWWRSPVSLGETRRRRRFSLEILTIALPLAIGSTYQFGVAAPRYVSESEFMVRTLSSSEMGNLATLLDDQKVTRASDETYAVSEYLTSRDAVETLVENDHLKDILGSPRADFFNRFPNKFTTGTREALYRHFQDYVELKINSDTGIARLRTVAFAPDEALALNRAMLRNAEGFVNRLNNRIFSDAVTLAERDVEQKKAEFSTIEARLTAYRNTQSVLDPNKEVSNALSRIGALMTKLSRAESDLAQTTALAPRAPQIASLASEVTALRDQISTERLRLSGQRSSLSGKFEEFDRITLDRSLASKQLEAALAQYDKARQDLVRQHFYLQTVVDPGTPDQASYPRRFANIALIAAFSMAGYSVLRAVLKNVLEHAP